MGKIKNERGQNKERGERLALERRAARLAAVQALYQWEATGAKPSAIIQEFALHRIGKIVEDVDLPPADRKLFSLLVEGTVSQVQELDDMIAGVLTEDWSVDRLEAILRAILRCGTFELANRNEVPPKVIISEYVAVADAFFSDKEIGLTNGVLDRLARSLRGGDLAGQGGVGKKGPGL